MPVLSFQPDKIAQAVAAVADNLQQSTFAPGAVVSVQNGSLVASAAAGLSDVAENQPTTINQHFEIGSQTKMFTAVVMLQLAEEGRIRLDDPVKDHLPSQLLDGIANTDQVTLKDLLAMRSGIPDFLSIPGQGEYGAAIEQVLANPDKIWGIDDALNLVRGVSADFAVNQNYSYSNTNFTLLGAVIENITGHSVAQEFKTRIFDPAGMTETTMNRFPVDDTRMHGYVGTIDATNTNWDPGAAGGGISTTQDMIKFMNALFGSGMLLSQDSLDQMQAPITLTGESPENKAREWFGLGLVTIDIDGQVFHGFTGATTTAISDSYFLENTGDISSSVINQTALTNDAASSGSLMVQNILSLATNPLIEQQDFDPSEDSIQVSGISASQIILRDAKDGTHLVYGGSDLRLGTSLLALSGNKILFDDQSIMRIGDDKANLLSIDKDYPDAAGLGNQFWGLAGRDTLIGGAGQDVLYGNQGRDDLSGGGGDDSLWGGLGTDSLKGGLGQDSLSGGNGQDLIYGNQGDDILYGNQNLDSLYGGRGDDQLFGGQGDDVLVGGLGNDVLNGGKGADRFVISNLETGHDVITDFSLAQGDVLVLSSGSLYQAIDQGNDVQIIVGDAVIDLIGVHDFSTAVVVFA